MVVGSYKTYYRTPMYIYRIKVMKGIPLDILSTTQKSWRRLGSEAVA